MLQDKSLIELRGIAQSLSIPDVFQKDKLQLVQAIEFKQQAVTVAPKIEMPRPPYDARLMTQAPAKIGDKDEVWGMIEPLIKRGLHAKFDEERWYFSHGKKTDEGTLRMPLRNIIKCAEAVLA